MGWCKHLQGCALNCLGVLGFWGFEVFRVKIEGYTLYCHIGSSSSKGAPKTPCHSSTPSCVSQQQRFLCGDACSVTAAPLTPLTPIPRPAPPTPPTPPTPRPPAPLPHRPAASLPPPLPPPPRPAPPSLSPAPPSAHRMYSMPSASVKVSSRAPPPPPYPAPPSLSPAPTLAHRMYSRPSARVKASSRAGVAPASYTQQERHREARRRQH